MAHILLRCCEALDLGAEYTLQYSLCEPLPYQRQWDADGFHKIHTVSGVLFIQLNLQAELLYAVLALAPARLDKEEDSTELTTT